jgi:N-carbamoyl-L-amino-acid hydrolase
MLFVPSVEGISHNEREYTNDENCCAGVTLLTAIAGRLVQGDLPSA